eukprot:15436255-Alexandrium_andersonii.AAC.1
MVSLVWAFSQSQSESLTHTHMLSALGRCDRCCDRDACDRRPCNTAATGVATGACDHRALDMN